MSWRISSDAELRPSSIPLISISRTPSPYITSGEGTSSDEDDDQRELDYISAGRPLVGTNDPRGKSTIHWLFQQGGLGYFLFGTWAGVQVYVALLVFWVGGCGFGLLLMNRFILLTGVYKFPYPLSTTILQLLIAHTSMLLSTSVLRALRSPFHSCGLTIIVPPSFPAAVTNSASSGFRGDRATTLFARLSKRAKSGTGGISGGGLFELDTHVAFQVLPLALTFVGKIILSNLSFAYGQLPMYTLARMPIPVLSLLLTSFLLREHHSASTISSVLTASLNLTVATTRPGVRVTWESIVSGIFSALFTALYPILVLRTHRVLTSQLLASNPDALASNNIGGDAPASTRAAYQLLHYTSFMSILLVLPILLLSGELGNISRNCYILDVPFFWVLTACGGLGAWAVFWSTPILIRAVGPLAATFIFVPRSAFQLVVLSHFKMPVYSWVGIGLCWLASIWFLLSKRRESRSRSWGR